MIATWEAIGRSALMSLAGVVVMTLAVFALGGVKRKTLTVSEAVEELSLSYPTFRPATWLIDHPGQQVALAVDAVGETMAVVFVFGETLVARAMAAGDCQIEHKGRHLKVATGDLITPDVKICITPPVDPKIIAFLARISR
jgi:hypothetical protein